MERARRRVTFAHEALARRADERDRLGEEHAHRVAQGDRLLVGVPATCDLRERRRGQLDRGVQGQRRELLALRLLHRLGLLLGELAQAAQEILGVAAEREPKPPPSMPCDALAQRRQLYRVSTSRDERLVDAPARTRRSRSRTATRARRARARGAASPRRSRRGTRARRPAAARRSPARARARPPRPPRSPRGCSIEPQLGQLRAQLVEVAAAGELAGELAHDDDRGDLAHGRAPVDRPRPRSSSTSHSSASSSPNATR